MSLSESDPLESVDDLVRYYQQHQNGSELYVGIEWERSAVDSDTLEPVVYSEDRGYLAILKKLSAEAGWDIVGGHRNEIFELKRGNAHVTIEGDGRLELSGSPQANLHDLAREFRIHAHEVQEMSDFFHISWLPLGWQPFHEDEKIQVLSKEPYNIYRKNVQNPHFELDPELESMLRRNNGLTVNYSFSSEENAIKKAQIGFRISPIVGAIFASSPFTEGEQGKYLDRRRKDIATFAPTRNIMPRSILEKDFSFRSWIEHYLPFPIFFIQKKDGSYLYPENLSFQEWIEKGYEGVFPTIKDFDKHVKTTWGDIRLRPSYLEYRVSDSVPLYISMAVPALIKGLVFDSQSWKAVEDLTQDWTYEDIVDLDQRAWEDGLQTEIKGKKLLFYAQELIQIADAALKRFQRSTAGQQIEDESIFLKPLKEQIFVKEKSIAEELVFLWNGDWEKNPKRLVAWCQGKNK